MDGSLPERFLVSQRTLGIIAVWIFLLFLSTNLPWQLDDYDQAKQAFVSFQIVREGDWLFQRLPLESVAQKPPFVGWVSAVFYQVTRSWDLAWRLPSLLSAIAIAILLLRAGTSAYGFIGGLISFAAFGLNLLSIRLATLVTTDMALALSIFLIGLLIWQKIRKGKPWNSRDRWWVFTLLTVSLLIKGPTVYAFLLPGIVAYAWRAHKDEWPSGWSGWWPWLGALAVFLLWASAGVVFKPGFYQQVVLREFLGRFSETVHRPQPVYFYLPHVLHKFAPWSLLIIFIAWLAVRQPRPRIRELFRRVSPEVFWLICWSLGGVVAMSLIPSKRVDRIFPILPPLCLLLGALVAHGLATDRTRKLVCIWSAAALLFSLLFSTGYSLWKIVPGYAHHRDALVTFCRKIRREAVAHPWHYEVVSSGNQNGTEGMLLYLEKLHFVTLNEAVEKWNKNQIQELVIPTDQVEAAMVALPETHVARTVKPKDIHVPGYVLVTRAPAA